jgi:carboxyl-terminal processing protease
MKKGTGKTGQTTMRTALAFGVTLAVLVAGLTGGTTIALEAYAAGGHAYAGLDTFARALGAIENHFVERPAPETLIRAAIDGMADSLDAHSEYFDPAEYRKLLDDTEGRYSGVGIEVQPLEDGGLLVVEVMAGGPAKAVGILAGDRIIGVDGTSVLDLAQGEIVHKIRGPRGETVRLEVLREGREDSLIFDVVRDAVHAPSVFHEWAEEGIAYIRIQQFRRRAATELKEALVALQEEEAPRAILLDLRSNPGGLLSEAVATVDVFLAEGQIVEIKGRSPEQETHEATKETLCPDTPLFVLVNGSSASAAEIVAGSLQDHARAVLVGQRTYGKGSVQSIFEFEDESALKITIAWYHLPSGKSVEDSGGIQPDEVLAWQVPEKDPLEQITARLENLPMDPSDQKLVSHVMDRLRAAESAQNRPPMRGSFGDRLLQDLQLQRALELARAASHP